MSRKYKLNEVVAEFTKGNYASDCLKYNADDLLEMFDQASVTRNANGDFEDFTVNEVVTFGTTDVNLVVTNECAPIGAGYDMFCYVNKNESETFVPCSADFDYEAYYSCS